MAKFLLIIGLVVGLIFAILFVRKMVYFKEDMQKYSQDHSSVSSSSSPSSKSSFVPTAEVQNEISFTYEKSDPFVSTAESPFVSSGRDYETGRATEKGVTVKTKNGVVLTQASPTQTEYVVTDVGRTEHRQVQFFGSSGPPLIVQADCPESDVRSVLGTGLWHNKDVGYGTVSEISKSKVVIIRFDGGKTILTPSRPSPSRSTAVSSETTLPPDLRNERGSSVQSIAAPPEPPPIPRAGGGAAAPVRK